MYAVGSCCACVIYLPGPSISNSKIAPLFVKMAQNLDLRCVLISDPGTLGAGAKTRLESRIKKFTPHCVCRPAGVRGPESEGCVYFTLLHVWPPKGWMGAFQAVCVVCPLSPNPCLTPRYHCTFLVRYFIKALRACGCQPQNRQMGLLNVTLQKIVRH